jgi:hypothetical protein
MEEGKGWRRHLPHCRLVNEPHFPLPPCAVVGVDRLVEALCGRDGRDHGRRIGGRKNEARGGIMGWGAVNAGHAARARTLPRTSASNRSGMRESRQSTWRFQSAACAAIAHSFTAGPPQRPLHTCTRSTLPQTSHALYDIRAILVGIVRKSCRRADSSQGGRGAARPRMYKTMFHRGKGMALRLSEQRGCPDFAPQSGTAILTVY